MTAKSNHVTRRCWRRMRRLREKVPALLPPRASHVLQPPVLCGFFLFFLGSRWGGFIGFQSQDFLLGLQNQAFSWAFTALSPLSLQAPWTLKSPRVQVIWSKEKTRKQRWIVSPKKDTLMFTGIARGWKKQLSFWLTFRIKTLWKIQKCSNSDFQLSAPKTLPAAWKSIPPRQRTQLCISVPAASPQCSTSALLRTQTHHEPSSGNQWCRRRVGTDRNPPWKSNSQKEKSVNGHTGWAEREVENSWWEHKSRMGQEAVRGLRFPGLQGIWRRRQRMWPWWINNSLYWNM